MFEKLIKIIDDSKPILTTFLQDVQNTGTKSINDLDMSIPNSVVSAIFDEIAEVIQIEKLEKTDQDYDLIQDGLNGGWGLSSPLTKRYDIQNLEILKDIHTDPLQFSHPNVFMVKIVSILFRILPLSHEIMESYDKCSAYITNLLNDDSICRAGM